MNLKLDTKVPSLLKLNEKELETPISINKSDKMKFGSVSTLPDNLTVNDSDNDKVKSLTPPSDTNKSKFVRKNKKLNAFRFENEISQEE